MFHFYFWKKERRCQFCCQWTGSSDNLSFSRDRACYVLSANYLFCLLVFSSSCLLIFLSFCLFKRTEWKFFILEKQCLLPVICQLSCLSSCILSFVFCLLSFQEDRVTIFHSWEIMPFICQVFLSVCVLPFCLFSFCPFVFFYFYLFKRIEWQFFILGGSSPLPFLCQVIM